MDYNLLPWWLTWIDGRAILFAGLLIWALRKALISGDIMTKDEDCLNNSVICGDCLRSDCKGCEY